MGSRKLPDENNPLGIRTLQNKKHNIILHHFSSRDLRAVFRSSKYQNYTKLGTLKLKEWISTFFKGGRREGNSKDEKEGWQTEQQGRKAPKDQISHTLITEG